MSSSGITNPMQILFKCTSQAVTCMESLEAQVAIAHYIYAHTSKKPSLVGLEPTTFELEVQCAIHCITGTATLPTSVVMQLCWSHVHLYVQCMCITHTHTHTQTQNIRKSAEQRTSHISIAIRDTTKFTHPMKSPLKCLPGQKQWNV